ncbi:MAG: hypothetical protein CMO46_11860 [Verrucomicrobiales bacterium]|nr:hypothetical protein [Verrucomicrobiales bacterium]|tara:strand:- start:5776 stop:6165 length:390 start_codon:yes stop_codon:yes gene_type:complete
MGYLNNKPGSIEEVIAKQTALESDYQDKFKKELEKAGKGIGSMTPAEKTAFFNKMDKKHSAKNESEVKEMGGLTASKKMKSEMGGLYANTKGSDCCGLPADKCKCSNEQTDTGKKETKIDTEPKINYNK